ncbi:MAG: aminotransferase class I/II-fold pyridoxal phosphate-dependent enzyme [Lentisphaerae bacterium]|nr:aminotransferase class I/II-fold pyridoxal phosphate-dependent enzyme [Lentisphaerota bacterium]
MSAKQEAFSAESFVVAPVRDLPKSGIREFFDLVAGRTDVISLGVGEPDFTTPWNIRESAIYSLEAGHTAYTSNAGTPALRKAICQYLHSDYQLDYDPMSECLVTIGVSEALDLAMRALINPGDEVIYTSPSFVSYPAEVLMARGVPVPLPTKDVDNFSVNPDDLRKLITPRSKVLLLNFPCNPTGAVANEDVLREIASIACEHNLIVISDEIYSELVYDGWKHVSIASLPGMKERTIFLHGFSKAFAMTGFRIGYVCAPKAITDAMYKIHQYSIMCASITAQEAALEALKTARKDMIAMRDSYWERRNIIVRGLRDAGLDCVMPQGAFYAFPSIKSTGMTSREFAEKLLKEESVAVVPGSAFGPGGEGYVRACYATAEDQIIEALKRIKRFVAKYSK